MKKNFIGFQILLLVVFALTLVFSSLLGIVDPTVLIIKALFSALAVSLGIAILFKETVRRYNPIGFITSFAIASINIIVGAFCTYLIYNAYQLDNWQLSNIMVIIAGIAFATVLSPLTLNSSFKNTKTILLYLAISLGQIILSGLMTWGAIEIWFAWI